MTIRSPVSHNLMRDWVAGVQRVHTPPVDISEYMFSHQEQPADNSTADIWGPNSVRFRFCAN